MGLRRKWIDPATTWLAEEHANTSLGQQERAEIGHRCGNCYGPFGLSAIPCKNARRDS